MQVFKEPVLCAVSGEPFGPAGTQSDPGHMNLTKEIVRRAAGRGTWGSAISPYRPTITGSQVPARTESHLAHIDVTKEIVRRAAGGESFFSAITVATAFPRIVEQSPETRCRPEDKAIEAI